MPPLPPIPLEKKRNPGLRVFCIIMAVALLLTGSLTAVYFSKPNSGGWQIETTSGSQSEESSQREGTVSEEPAAPPFVGDNSTTIDMESKTPASDPVTNTVSQVASSVVGIVVYDPGASGGYGYATGILISPDGYLVTNDHVYAGFADPKFLIYTYDGREYEAFYVAGDARNDLAVLKVKNGSGFKPAVFANSDQLAVGETVIAIGNPGGMAFANTVTKGIISAISRRVSGNAGYSIKVIQTDTAINPGNSGGPLIDMSGCVVGVNSSKIVQSGFEGMGFSIPSTTVQKTVNDLIKYGAVQNRARLGITYTVIEKWISNQTGIPQGLQISTITAESDFYGKGAASGDVITEINGRQITSGDMVLDLIEGSKPGDIIKLTVYSKENKTTQVYSVRLIADAGASSYKSIDPTSSNPFEE